MSFLEVEWPFLLCILQVCACVVAGIAIAIKFEAPPATTPRSAQLVRCCSDLLHPAWLAAFRTASFLYLLSIWIISVVVNGPMSFVFYTQWTFTLLVVFFGLASFISITDIVKRKQGPKLEEILLDEEAETLVNIAEVEANSPAGWLGHTTLVLFQMAAAASILTDGIYWIVLVPFVLASPYFDLNFININLHGVNAIFLLVEFFLNDLPFPWFRGAYFVFWTAIYVFFEWTIHGTGLINWWPYPFLEVSTHYAPLWYFSVACAHLISLLICLALARAKQRVVSYVVNRNSRQK